MIAYAFKAFEISDRGGELRMAQALARCRKFEANGRCTGSHIADVRAVGPVGGTGNGRRTGGRTERGPSDERRILETRTI